MAARLLELRERPALQCTSELALWRGGKILIGKKLVVGQGLRRDSNCAVRKQGGCEESPSEAQAGHLSQVWDSVD